MYLTGYADIRYRNDILDVRRRSRKNVLQWMNLLQNKEKTT